MNRLHPDCKPCIINQQIYISPFPGYVFQVEMSYLGHLLGYRFTEVPIYFADRRWGQSKMSLRIQVEAALRVWNLLYQYRDLRRAAQ